YARILNIVDAFDAMASNRCYRSALSMDKILKEIKENIGKQFDPTYAQLFLDLIPSIAYADLNSEKKEYFSPFSKEALEIPADSFVAGKRSDFERHGYSPSKSLKSKG
ncbi:MAG: hypothetical protein DRG25_04295, partial [Deltaproteobacteria bacterium]